MHSTRSGLRRPLKSHRPFDLLFCPGGLYSFPAMCSIEKAPAKRAKVNPPVDVRHANGFRSYTSIVYPPSEAFVSAPAPDFQAPGAYGSMCRKLILPRPHVTSSGVQWVGSRLYCCHVAIIDGEISEVALSNYKGQYVILFFYPKVCLQDCLCRAACMLQCITLSRNCLLRVACLLQSY